MSRFAQVQQPGPPDLELSRFQGSKWTSSDLDHFQSVVQSMKGRRTVKDLWAEKASMFVNKIQIHVVLYACSFHDLSEQPVDNNICRELYGKQSVV